MVKEAAEFLWTNRAHPLAQVGLILLGAGIIVGFAARGLWKYADKVRSIVNANWVATRVVLLVLVFISLASLFSAGALFIHRYSSSSSPGSPGSPDPRPLIDKAGITCLGDEPRTREQILDVLSKTCNTPSYRDYRRSLQSPSEERTCYHVSLDLPGSETNAKAGSHCYRPTTVIEWESRDCLETLACYRGQREVGRRVGKKSGELQLKEMPGPEPDALN